MQWRQGWRTAARFLDHRLAAWAATPYKTKFEGAQNKLELRALFERFVPLPTARRLDKQGFRWVYGRFFRQNRRWVTDLIGDSALARRLCRLDAVTRELTENTTPPTGALAAAARPCRP
jgi:hypothetical protein